MVNLFINLKHISLDISNCFPDVLRSEKAVFSFCLVISLMFVHLKLFFNVNACSSDDLDIRNF